MNSAAPLPAFRRFWLGQFISNLGTQVCLYALALWLFRRDGQLAAVAAVAVVVQLAKVATMPVISRWLPLWPRRRVMVICNLASAFSTMSLAGLLTIYGSRFPLLGVVPWLAMAASMEAILGLCLTTMVPLMLPKGRWASVNGWIAAADGVVNMASPFLGALVALNLGLSGIAFLDAFSTGVALLSVCIGFWPEHCLDPPRIHFKIDLVGIRRNLNHLLGLPSARSLLLVGATLMAVHAADEVLFPAWIIVSFPPGTLPRVLIFSSFSYAAGVFFWQRWGNRGWRIWLVLGLLIQALVLMAAVWEGFEQLIEIWFFGVTLFNFTVPIVSASLHTLWMTLIPVSQQIGRFSARNALDWSARLVGAALAGLMADRWLSPLLSSSHLSFWLGSGPGRPMAALLALAGLLQMVVVLIHIPALMADSDWQPGT